LRCWGLCHFSLFSESTANYVCTDLWFTNFPCGISPPDSNNVPNTWTSPITAVSIGDEFACVLLQDTTVHCWGDNNYGQCGRGTFGLAGDDGLIRSDQTIPVLNTSDVVQFATGSAHTCVRTSFGELRCWGSGLSGELGTGGDSDLASPPADPILHDVIQVAAARYSTCAIVGSGVNGVRCWGNNQFGQLGTGDFESLFAPPASSIVEGVVEIDMSEGHVCAITGSSRGLRCWGRNLHSQTGVAADQDFVRDVLADLAFNSLSGMLFNPCVVVNASTCIPQPPDTDVLTGVSHVATGDKFTCVVLEATLAIRCFGYGQDGALGNGGTSDYVLLEDAVDVHLKSPLAYSPSKSISETSSTTASSSPTPSETSSPTATSVDLLSSKDGKTARTRTNRGTIAGIVSGFTFVIVLALVMLFCGEAGALRWSRLRSKCLRCSGREVSRNRRPRHSPKRVIPLDSSTAVTPMENPWSTNSGGGGQTQDFAVTGRQIDPLTYVFHAVWRVPPLTAATPPVHYCVRSCLQSVVWSTLPLFLWVHVGDITCCLWFDLLQYVRAHAHQVEYAVKFGPYRWNPVATGREVRVLSASCFSRDWMRVHGLCFRGRRLSLNCLRVTKLD
jgi:hypothetical protein